MSWYRSPSRQQAHIASDGYYNVTHAQQWNTTSAEAVAADAALLESCGNDFALMCRAKQGKLVHNRLSVRRVIETFGPLGMSPSRFRSEWHNPSRRDRFCPSSGQLTTSAAALYHTKAHCEQPDDIQTMGRRHNGFARHVAKKIQGIHFSAQHQADSMGKQEGRVIGDLSLNGTSDSKDALRRDIAQAWGKIKQPTVVQLVLMVLKAADVHGWAESVLWKKDLKGAFNLLNYNSDYCKLFAFPLSDGLRIVHMAGLFGWIGMPHAFQVLTRSLHALCSYIILGPCYWYVDDLMAVSPISSSKVDESVQHLLGDGSIAKQKSQCARQLEFLGWLFDLDTRTITLCDRNLHKFLHALFCFDTSKKVSIALIQRVASLASRTSLLNRHMRPYTHELHGITSGYSQPHIRIALTLQAQTEIIMWRSFVLLLVAQPTKLSRSMESFRPQAPQYCFKYDASLTRIAVGVYTSVSDELLTFHWESW